MLSLLAQTDKLTFDRNELELEAVRENLDEVAAFLEERLDATDCTSKARMQEKAGQYHVLHIHVPIIATVVRHKNRIFDRNGDADIDITDLPDSVFQCYARKQSSYYVNRVYPHWKVSDLRADLIDKAREMAVLRKQLFDKQRHPWADMSNEELLRTSGLILTDEQGRTGITLAAVLLFGTDNMIASACAHHKTDCIYRVYKP